MNNRQRNNGNRIKKKIITAQLRRELNPIKLCEQNIMRWVINLIKIYKYIALLSFLRAKYRWLYYTDKLRRVTLFKEAGRLARAIYARTWCINKGPGAPLSEIPPREKGEGGDFVGHIILRRDVCIDERHDPPSLLRFAPRAIKRNYRRSLGVTR